MCVMVTTDIIMPSQPYNFHNKIKWESEAYCMLLDFEYAVRLVHTVSKQPNNIQHLNRMIAKVYSLRCRMLS